MIEKAVEAPKRLLEVESCGCMVHMRARAGVTLFNGEIAPAPTTGEKSFSARRQLFCEDSQGYRIAVASLDKFCLNMLVIEAVANAE
ncbi:MULTISPECIES: hypothetical protein [unclassified Bradyrhizobium]|uniref:hypothetical protein n=1 Tax=unclassified Bradyrhizobium TaxID=2631580 RepID=UPI001FF8BCC6|nr:MULTISPECIES: hypothetical protein [unclassified Bradyrhizobium]MCK1614658.1 hypothetical protein [Bradyrhizobium sp. 163]MCK1763663.1 hypothetical protein [Bradyrhizobium sp. 136]